MFAVGQAEVVAHVETLDQHLATFEQTLEALYRREDIDAAVRTFARGLSLASAALQVALDAQHGSDLDRRHLSLVIAGTLARDAARSARIEGVSREFAFCVDALDQAARLCESRLLRSA